jgi:phenol hydroxylase P2 protein
MARNVSIVLQDTADALPIIEAIKADNPDAEIQNMPSLVRIEAPGKLVIKRDSVSERLGRDWDVQEIQLSMVTLSGNIDEDDDQFVISWQ